MGIELFAVSILGLQFGSFANVCIYRWPRNASVLRPHRSYCVWCRGTISWFDNIPLLSVLFLKGRCRLCKTPISLRYPLVELSMTLLWVSWFLFVRPVSGCSDLVFLVLGWVGLFVAVVTSLIDMDWRIIPDEASFFLIIVGLLLSTWNTYFLPAGMNRFLSSLLGVLAGASILYAISVVGRWAFCKEVMGGGDIKLLAGWGAIFGWKGAVVILMISSLFGAAASLVGIGLRKLRRGQYIPFGPFINMAAVALMFLRVAQPDFFEDFR